MYCPQFGQTTWGGTAVLQVGQCINCRAFLASCDRRAPLREGLVLRFGTAIVFLSTPNGVIDTDQRRFSADQRQRPLKLHVNPKW